MSEQEKAASLADVPGIPSTEDVGNAVCIWWSNLTREQRTWVYFTASFMQADLFVLKGTQVEQTSSGDPS